MAERCLQHVDDNLASWDTAIPHIFCVQERGRMLNKLADLVEQHAEEFALLESLVSIHDDNICIDLCCYKHLHGHAGHRKALPSCSDDGYTWISDPSTA